MKQSRLFNFPFYILLFGLFLPMIAAYLWIEMHRTIFILMIYLFLIINIIEKNSLNIKKSHFLFLLTLLLFFTYDYFSGRRLYFFSYSHIVFYTFIFYYSFKIGDRSDSYKIIIKQVSFVYGLLLISMLLELLIQLSGNTDILLNAFTQPTPFPRLA